MKLTFICVFLPFFIFCQFTKEDLKHLKSLTKGSNLTWQNDPNKQIFFIKTKKMGYTGGELEFYFGIKKINGIMVKQPMRITINYRGPNWIFFNNVSFAFTTLENGDDTLGIPTTINYNDDKTNRVVLSNASVLETSDVSLDHQNYTFFKFLSKNNRLISLVLSGSDKYYKSAIFGFVISSRVNPLFELYESM